MRILGFSRKDLMNYATGKPKLEEDNFITFRFTRRDKDWEVGELVQVVIKPRTKGREPLGIAKIISKKRGWLYKVTDKEAMRDGFRDFREMWEWVNKTHGKRLYQEPMNKLTLVWVERRKYR